MKIKFLQILAVALVIITLAGGLTVGAAAFSTYTYT